MSLESITGKDFREKVLAASVPALLLYHSKWNKSCEGQVEVLEEVAQSLSGQSILIAQTNGDQEAELDAWFRIIDFPTAVLYRDGKELGRICGPHTKEEYLAFVERMLGAPAIRDVMADTWVATDRLGRTLPTWEEVGAPKKDKYIAMFYFISFGKNNPDPEKRTGPFDISKILAEHPDAMDNPNSPPWGPYGTTHHWGESLYGYYLSSDPYVIAKHAQMLGDAGVDVIIFDVSNFQNTDPPGAYFYDTFMNIFETFHQVREKGRRTPQIAFLFNFWYGPYAVRQIYRDLYSKGLYSDLWFRWEGKPLVMFDKEKVPLEEKELRDFFTYRRPMPDYFYGPQGPDQWAWCEIYPQHGFYSAKEPGKVEQVPVSVAQNAVPDPDTEGGWTLGCMSQRDENGRFVARGRSYCGGKQPEEYHPEQGANFAEQWERAFQLDPKLVFVTGWNEWVMGRMPEFIHEKAPNVMVDQFNTEFSRDLEPSRGPIGDSAYLQFIRYAREFKGVRPIPVSDGQKTISLSGGFQQWQEVGPVYLDDVGDLESRDWEGYGNIGMYQSDTGRNDLAEMKMVRDTEYLYAYAKTAAPLTPCQDPLWMNLLLHIGEGVNWEGFQFLVRPDEKNQMTLYRCGGGFSWQPVCSVKVTAEGNQLMMALPLSALGLSGEKKITFDFKWCDNIPLGSDPYVLEFYTHGDAAPNGRFCYRYLEK